MNNLYPFESRYCNINGLQYHYLDEGQGEPVLMVHGNPSWSFYYRNLVSRLTPHRRCIVPDHIGCGFSAKPDDSGYDFSLERRIEDLCELVKELGVRERITLIVHDWGGMIGMGYATRFPESIGRIVVLNTAAFHIPSGKQVPLSLKLSRTPLLGGLLVRGLNLFSRGAARYCCTRNPMSQEIRDWYLKPYDSWANRIAVHRFVQDIPLNSSHRSYSAVSDISSKLDLFSKTPMLICWGGQDFVFDNDFLSEWTVRFPAAQTHLFPDAGHYILEDAADEIIPLIESFMATSSPVTSQ